MARTLCFTQITDDRFDTNIKELLQQRVDKIKELLNIDGVTVTTFPIDEIHFNERTEHCDKGYYKDNPVTYTVPANTQCRCRIEVKKNTCKVTWNDIYKLVNSVKPVRYSFI